MLKAVDLAVVVVGESAALPVEGNEGVLEVQAIDCTPAPLMMHVEKKPASPTVCYSNMTDMTGMRDEVMKMTMMTLSFQTSRDTSLHCCSCSNYMVR